MIKDILKKLKKYKGVLSAKDRYINYREAHRLQYGFFKGLFTFRPDKAVKHINANDMDFLEYEGNNKHYEDTAFTIGYTSKYILLTKYTPELIHLLI